MTENSLIGSISIDALLAAKDAAHHALRECKRLLDDADARLKPFGISMPKIEMCHPGNSYRCIRAEDYQARNFREIDRHVWLELMTRTGITTVMDASTRGKFEAMLRQGDAYGSHDKSPELPELTRENLIASFLEITGRREEYFQNAVEAVFRKLSWDYKTNVPGLIGDKIILDYAIESWSRGGGTASLQSSESLRDLERVLCVLDGQPLPSYEYGINAMRAVPYGVWTTVPSATVPLIELKVFKKGSAHVRILNREHVRSLNRIMAQRYPAALGSGSRKKERSKREG